MLTRFHALHLLRMAVGRVRSSSLGRRLIKGVFWSFIGSVVARVLEFLSSILVARVLGKSGFGEFGMVRSTVGMFGVFAGFGLGATATKHVAEFRTKAPLRTGRILGLISGVALGNGSIMAIAMFVLASWLARSILNAPYLAHFLRIGALLVLLRTINGAQIGALAGFEAFRAIATRSMCVGIASVPLVAGGAYLKGLYGAVWGLIISMTVGCLVNQIALLKEMKRSEIRLYLNGIREEYSILFQFSLPAFLSSTMVGPVIWVCNSMLVNQAGGYEQMGIFNAAYVFHNLIPMLTSVVGAPLLPVITSELDKKNPLLDRLNVLLTWLTGMLVALPIVTFPELIGWIYGEEYNSTAFRSVLVLLLCSTMVVIYKQGFARALISQGLMWWAFADNLLWGSVMVLASSQLVRHGAMGLGASYLMAYALNALIVVPLYMKYKLVPRSAIVSLGVGAVWMAFAAVIVASLAGFNVPIRFMLFLLGLTTIVMELHRIVTSGSRA